MANDKLARKLHDKATRGEALTGEDRAQLEEWYKQQDRGEAAMLGPSTPDSAAPLDDLRKELGAALTRLREETQRLQIQADANEALRRENAALSERLAHAQTRQAA